MPVGPGGVFDHQAGDSLTEALLQRKATAAHEWDRRLASRQTGGASIAHENAEMQVSVLTPSDGAMLALAYGFWMAYRGKVRDIG